MTAVEKITISIPGDVAAWARDRARSKHGGNLSAYVTDALRKAELQAAFDALEGYDVLMPEDFLGDAE